MLDYHNLEALEAVIETGSFHRAATKLRITQSAVSQRIATLEESLGSPVVVRAIPPVATRIGIQLIHHLKEVRAKEQELGVESGPTPLSGWTEMTLGANADSAATWFLEAIQPVLMKRKILLKLLVETDVLVHDLIQRGEAQGCVMGKKRPLPGCDSLTLGRMEYICVCTPEFKRTWFPKGFLQSELSHTPTVLFDQYDTMHHLFLQKRFGIRRPSFPHHTVNSSSGFLALIQSGGAYGMLPRLQAEGALKRKELIELAPKHSVDLPLYWMYPRRGAKTFLGLWEALQEGAAKLLL